MRGAVTGIVVILILGVFFPITADAGNIVGRLEGSTGGGLREAVCWTTGTGANAATAQGMGMHYGGTYTISGLSAGLYNMVAGEFAGYRHAFTYGVSVPSSGDVNVDIRHTGAMEVPGFTWLAPCSEAGQTFVANGRSLWSITINSAAGGIDVQATVHEGGPGGPQIGPARVKGPELYPPAIFRWKRGEVPLVPGKIYYVKLVRTDGPTWLPCLSKDWDAYPNGIAYLDGVPYPDYDLNMGAVCIDDGYVWEVSVHSGYRTDQQHEIGQTFVANGEELRCAQFHVVSGEGMMRVSVHNGVGGPQIGPTKRAEMGTYFPGTAVWGPGEVPLTPGNTYYVKLTRDDGSLFGIYGTENDYPNGELYLDGVPSGVDAECTFITKEVDLPDVTVSNIQESGLTGQNATITCNTNIGASSYVQYWTGSPPEVWKNISEFDGTLSTSHSVTLTGLERGTTYSYRVYSWRDGYDPGVSAVGDFTTPSTTGTITGTVTASGGGALAEAKITLEPGGFETESNASGVYSIAVPPGTFQMSVSRYGYAGAVASGVTVAAAGTTVRDFALTAVTNQLANGGFESGMTGWTSYGRFDGAFNDGNYGVPSRTGTRWAGSVGNWDPKTGGIHQTVTVNPAQVYDVVAYAYTEGFNVGDDSTGQGHAQVRTGYDPSGGTDPSAPSVVWTNWTFTAARWLELSLSATAPSGSLTVFLESRHSEYWGSLEWFKIGFDDVSVHPQTNVTTGTVSGTVIAANTTQPIEGALVEVLGTTRYAYTNENGQYSIPGVNPGTYNVRATKAGYDQQTRTGREVRLGEITVVDFSLTGPGLPLELVNPSFETGDDTGWSWHSFEGTPDGVFGPNPWYAGITASDGSDGYGVATSWGYKAGALYQKIQGIKGRNYSASCCIRTYQSSPGGDNAVTGRIGISPTGSTDPTLGVVWGSRTSAPSGWLQLTLNNVYVNSTEVTVFCEVGMSSPREWQIVAMDLFSLVPEGVIPTPVPTATPTPEPTPGPGVNLLANWSFEDSGGTSHPGWTNNSAWGTNGTFPNPGGAYDGYQWASYSYGEGSSVVQDLYQSVPVTPGHTYRLAVWADLGGSVGSETMSLLWSNGGYPGSSGGTPVGSLSWSNGDPGMEWTEISGEISPPGSTVTYILRAEISGWGAGANLDACSMVDVSGPETPTPVPTPTPTPVETPTPPSASVPAALWAY